MEEEKWVWLGAKQGFKVLLIRVKEEEAEPRAIQDGWPQFRISTNHGDVAKWLQDEIRKDIEEGYAAIQAIKKSKARDAKGAEHVPGAAKRYRKKPPRRREPDGQDKYIRQPK